MNASLIFIIFLIHNLIQPTIIPLPLILSYSIISYQSFHAPTFDYFHCPLGR